MNLTHLTNLFGGGTGGAGKMSAAAGLWRVYGTAVAVCAGLSVAAYLFGVQPALATHDADQAYAAELQSRRDKTADLVAELATTRRNLDRTRAQVEALPLRLEPASTMNQRLARLADLASAVGLTINEVQPGAPIDAAPYQSVPLRISGNGTYPACARFLHRLRDKFPDTAVRSFEAANPSPTRDNTAGTFRLELTWYTAPEKKS